MSKSSYSSVAKAAGCKAPSGPGLSRSMPDLKSINPSSQQFAPTPAKPINQHKQMAGVS